MPDVNQIDHPLVAHHLSRLRDRDTDAAQCRALVQRLTFLLTIEAVRRFPLRPTRVQTPLTETAGARLEPSLAVIPILPPGLGMVDAVLQMIPEAAVWHLGIYRDETTLKPVEYYQKLPQGSPADVAMVLDPMLATGGSSSAAIEAVEQWGASKILLLSIIAAPEGLAHVRKKHPRTQIHVCAIDSHLDDRGFIVPGLGDAGDRTFNTL